MDNFTDFELLADIDSVTQPSALLVTSQTTQESGLPVDYEVRDGGSPTYFCVIA